MKENLLSMLNILLKTSGLVCLNHNLATIIQAQLEPIGLHRGHLINYKIKVQFRNFPGSYLNLAAALLIVDSNCNGSNKTSVTNYRNLVSLPFG